MAILSPEPKTRPEGDEAKKSDLKQVDVLTYWDNVRNLVAFWYVFLSNSSALFVRKVE